MKVLYTLLTRTLYTKKGKIRKQASRRRDKNKIEPKKGPIPQKKKNQDI